MKTILLLRHAKSAWNAIGVPDHDRQLNPRGKRAAEAMARYIARHSPIAELILCSTAVRTRQTLAPLLEALPTPAPLVVLEERLYLASQSALLDRLRSLPENVATVLLVGHNEGIGELASTLAGSGPSERLNALHEKYPTGALAVLKFPAQTWAEVSPGSGTLCDFVRPRDLPQDEDM